MNWRYAHTTLALCTLAFTVTMIGRVVISPLVPVITADFGVSNTALGFALSAMWATYAMTQFPSGIFGDRFGEKRVITASIGLTGLSVLLLAASPSYHFFVLFTIVLGFGAGLHYTVATTYLAKQFDDVGRAIGFHISGGPIAGLVTPVAAALIAGRYGWRTGLLFGTAVAIPAFVLFVWRIRPTEPDRPDQPMRERIRPEVVLELLSRPSIVFTTVLSFLSTFVWQATTSFLPTFFADGQGLSPALASGLFSLCFVVHGLSQPAMGWLSDRVGRDPTAALTMGSGIVGYGFLAVGSEMVPFVIGAAFVGIAMSWGAPVQTRFMDLFTSAERGAGFGLVRTVYMTTGALGSVAVGGIADLYGWNASFGLLAVVMGLAFASLAANRLFRLGL